MNKNGIVNKVEEVRKKVGRGTFFFSLRCMSFLPVKKIALPDTFLDVI
jgi:hypothetical protein